MRPPRKFTFVALAVVCGLLLGACAQEEYPTWLYEAQHASPQPPGAADAGPPLVLGPQSCTQARATPLPQRLVVASAKASSSGLTKTVGDVYDEFVSACGSCHGPGNDQGSFQLASPGDFLAGFGKKELAHVTSDGPSNAAVPMSPTDPLDPMPPFNSANGKPFSERTADDVVYQFAQLAQQWLAAGSPAIFTPPQVVADGGAAEGGAPGQYLMTPAAAAAMTNLGDCIPNKDLFAIEKTKSAALDATFAAMAAKDSGSGADQIGLPATLSQTDLFTFDSRTLAEYGVVAFAPGYPLWSDDAGKLRHIRLPRGTSLQFDKTTQRFTVPNNTRVYKTFMKPVYDTDGSLRWRKIETRLILSRTQDPAQEGDDSVTSIYGAYKWRDDESDADLITDALRDGTPWTDKEFVYHTDEQLAADILASNPENPDDTLVAYGAARHYAMPSRDRCNECHQGSQSRSFILGLIPVQLNRRPVGQSGIIEPTGPDELTQFQRLVDYGVITGVDDLSDVLPLEKLEEPREPRNDYELTAQGYVLGNCSHCHNPHGDPSVENPVLKHDMDFLPSTDPWGGIFQFPLEHYSQRIFRGLDGNTRIPYITPSLMDHPRRVPGTTITTADPFMNLQHVRSINFVASGAYAPWRSLIYRNTDDAFAYGDDNAIFPHMPANSPGYDPRVRRILSDWMVSIPAVRKNPESPEYDFFVTSTADPVVTAMGGGVADENDQPYVEVLPGDPRYPDALAGAAERLQILHSGVNPNVPMLSPANNSVLTPYSRYADPGELDDVVDPTVEADPVCNEVPVASPATQAVLTPAFAVPGHAHWVVTDLTDVATWSPRGSDWLTTLVQKAPPLASRQCGSLASSVLTANQDEVLAVGMLQDLTLDLNGARSAFFEKPLPYGLWVESPSCDYGSTQTVSAYEGSVQDVPVWMKKLPSSSGGAHVFSQTPGAAVFKAICINCHGPLADSNGRIAKNVAVMTGGNARVADFHDGMFGPASSPGGNVHAVFGQGGDLSTMVPGGVPAAWQSVGGVAVTDDDRAARYMAWMGLGGTRVRIPDQILNIVGTTQVLGATRRLPGQLSGNMLSVAKNLCTAVLGKVFPDDEKKTFVPSDPLSYSGSLIHTNGDANMWLHLCSLNNPPPVRMVRRSSGVMTAPYNVIDANGTYAQEIDLVAPSTFEQYATSGACVVGNERGGCDPYLWPGRASGNPSNLPPNLWPWCVDTEDNGELPLDPTTPVCPWQDPNATQPTFWTSADADAWSVRGAINAGFAVYLHVQSIETTGPLPDYDQCP